MQLDVRGLSRLADPRDVGLARHERVHPVDEQLGVLDGEPELERGDLGGDRRRVVVAHVELAALDELVEPRPCELPDRVLHRRHRARPERAEQRLAQLRVHRRVEHRERGHGTTDGRVGWTVVMTQQRLAVEHRALEDREPLAVAEHAPHVVEPGERERVVRGQRHHPVTGPQLPVQRVRVGHHLDGERVVPHVDRHERRP